VARRAEDQYIGINAGVSSHIGMEFLLNYQLLQTSQFQLSSYFSAAVNRFTFKDFIDGDNNYSGNKLWRSCTMEWDWTQVAQAVLALLLLFSKVGRIPMNDQNSNTPRRIAF
jgi:iron complex outermembrane receptor protein